MAPVNLLFFAWLVLGRPTPSASLTRIKGAVTTAILLTFFVYLVLLMPTATPEQFWRVQNFALHFIAPILVILDWLLYDAKGHYRWFEPLTWTVLPLIYMTFALITKKPHLIPTFSSTLTALAGGAWANILSPFWRSSSCWPMACWP